MILSSKEEIEMYLRMVKRSKIKESIFCYWCTIYEEELLKTKEREELLEFALKNIQIVGILKISY